MSCCIEPFFKLHCQIIRKTKICHVQTIKVFKSIKKNLVFTRFLLSGLIFFWISNLTNFVNNKPDFPLPCLRVLSSSHVYKNFKGVEYGQGHVFPKVEMGTRGRHWYWTCGMHLGLSRSYKILFIFHHIYEVFQILRF